MYSCPLMNLCIDGLTFHTASSVQWLPLSAADDRLANKQFVAFYGIFTLTF